MMILELLEMVDFGKFKGNNYFKSEHEFNFQNPGKSAEKLIIFQHYFIKKQKLHFSNSI
jgi:hypothetical protein